jgi:UPF0755 protein
MKKLTIVILILIVIVLAGLFWWNYGMSPANINTKQSVSFVIKKGTGLKEIASNLKDAGLIRNRIVFFLYTRLGRFEGKIQAGEFNLSPSMSASEIAQNLTHGTFDVEVLIKEGLRATEIAEILEDNIPTYDSTWINSLVMNEGYLFPAKYDFSKDTDIETIIKKMRNAFNQNFATINTNNSKLTKNQIVILASLIERESGKDPAEKPIIAGILMNRLNAGIPLQVDASIQYAKGQNPVTKKWWVPVTIEEYKNVISNYNTYLFAGLPPGPISNPGRDSLNAAANPADTDYLYYLHDKNGQIRYAKTLAEHEANIQKYGVN